MDLREKKLVIISHCILNQNSVVYPLARAKGAYNTIINELLKRNYAIYQLACPESEFLGLDRKPMTYEDYASLPGYRKACEDLALSELKNIRKYKDAGYKLLGLIGIDKSPNCSIRENRGVFMEELFKLLDKESIDLKSYDISTSYVETRENNLEDFLDFLDS